jgi:hypothetical protein
MLQFELKLKCGMWVKPEGVMQSAPIGSIPVFKILKEKINTIAE